VVKLQGEVQKVDHSLIVLAGSVKDINSDTHVFETLTDLRNVVQDLKKIRDELIKTDNTKIIAGGVTSLAGSIIGTKLGG
jgi:cob(I)alamin adenosyltransferase